MARSYLQQRSLPRLDIPSRVCSCTNLQQVVIMNQSQEQEIVAYGHKTQRAQERELGPIRIGKKWTFSGMLGMTVLGDKGRHVNCVQEIEKYKSRIVKLRSADEESRK